LVVNKNPDSDQNDNHHNIGLHFPEWLLFFEQLVKYPANKREGD
jgi:hypothetical protein